MANEAVVSQPTEHVDPITKKPLEQQQPFQADAAEGAKRLSDQAPAMHNPTAGNSDASALTNQTQADRASGISPARAVVINGENGMLSTNGKETTFKTNDGKATYSVEMNGNGTANLTPRNSDAPPIANVKVDRPAPDSRFIDASPPPPRVSEVKSSQPESQSRTPGNGVEIASSTDTAKASLNNTVVKAEGQVTPTPTPTNVTNNLGPTEVAGSSSNRQPVASDSPAPVITRVGQAISNPVSAPAENLGSAQHDTTHATHIGDVPPPVQGAIAPVVKDVSAPVVSGVTGGALEQQPSKPPAHTELPLPVASNPAAPVRSEVPVAANPAAPVRSEVPVVANPAAPVRSEVPVAANPASPVRSEVPVAANPAAPVRSEVPVAANPAAPVRSEVPVVANPAAPVRSEVPVAANPAAPVRSEVPVAANPAAPVRSEVPVASNPASPVRSEVPVAANPASPVRSEVPVAANPAAPVRSEVPVAANPAAPVRSEVPVASNPASPVRSEVPVAANPASPVRSEVPVAANPAAPVRSEVPIASNPAAPVRSEVPVASNPAAPVRSEVPVVANPAAPVRSEVPVAANPASPVRSEVPVAANPASPVRSEVPVVANPAAPVRSEVPVVANPATPLGGILPERNVISTNADLKQTPIDASTLNKNPINIVVRQTPTSEVQSTTTPSPSPPERVVTTASTANSGHPLGDAAPAVPAAPGAPSTILVPGANSTQAPEKVKTVDTVKVDDSSTVARGVNNGVLRPTTPTTDVQVQTPTPAQPGNLAPVSLGAGTAAPERNSSSAGGEVKQTQSQIDAAALALAAAAAANKQAAAGALTGGGHIDAPSSPGTIAVPAPDRVPKGVDDPNSGLKISNPGNRQTAAPAEATTTAAVAAPPAIGTPVAPGDVKVRGGGDNVQIDIAAQAAAAAAKAANGSGLNSTNPVGDSAPSQSGAPTLEKARGSGSTEVQQSADASAGKVVTPSGSARPAGAEPSPGDPTGQPSKVGKVDGTTLSPTPSSTDASAVKVSQQPNSPSPIDKTPPPAPGESAPKPTLGMGADSGAKGSSDGSGMLQKPGRDGATASGAVDGAAAPNPVKVGDTLKPTLPSDAQNPANPQSQAMTDFQMLRQQMMQNRQAMQDAALQAGLIPGAQPGGEMDMAQRRAAWLANRQAMLDAATLATIGPAGQEMNLLRQQFLLNRQAIADGTTAGAMSGALDPTQARILMWQQWRLQQQQLLDQSAAMQGPDFMAMRMAWMQQQQLLQQQNLLRPGMQDGAPTPDMISMRQQMLQRMGEFLRNGNTTEQLAMGVDGRLFKELNRVAETSGEVGKRGNIAELMNRRFEGQPEGNLTSRENLAHGSRLDHLLPSRIEAQTRPDMQSLTREQLILASRPAIESLRQPLNTPGRGEDKADDHKLTRADSLQTSVRRVTESIIETGAGARAAHDASKKIEHKIDNILLGNRQNEAETLGNRQIASAGGGGGGGGSAKASEVANVMNNSTDAALLAAITARKMQDEKDLKERLLQQEKAKKKDDGKRRKIVVKDKDTLDSICKRHLRDVRLVPLIYEINAHILQAKAKIKKNGEVQLVAGTILWLPSTTEVEEFRAKLAAGYNPGIRDGDKPLTAEEELSERFGANWSGSDANKSEDPQQNLKQKMMDIAAEASAVRRQNIESLLGPLDSHANEDSVTYTARLGDTLKFIAVKHPALKDTSLWELLAIVNQLSIDVDAKGVPVQKVARGQKLRIPNQQEIDAFKAERRSVSQRKADEFISPTTNLQSDTTIVEGSQPPITFNSLKDAGALMLQAGGFNAITKPIKESSTDPIFPAGAPTEFLSNTEFENAQNELLQNSKAIENVRELSDDCRVVRRHLAHFDGTRSYQAQLDVMVNGQWKIALLYNVSDTDSWRKRFALDGKVEKVKVQLPTSAIHQMLENDVNSNWQSYRDQMKV